MSYPNPEFLVETDWLESHLSAPDIRIIDCRINFSMDEAGDIQFTSGREDWAGGHIPGAVHVNIYEDLSRKDHELPFMLPGEEQFSAVMSRLGVGDGVRVVLYDAFYNIWAARLWWMLRTFGFTDAAVLNGGLNKWTMENRPLSTDSEAPAPAQFAANPVDQIFVGKEAVQSAIDDDHTCIVDALYPEHYSGESPSWVARPGHIKSARNLSFNSVVDEETHAYLPPEDLALALERLGLGSEDGVITYCHAGNAASSVAFAAALMGRKRVSIYDGSLREWAADPTLPMNSAL